MVEKEAIHSSKVGVNVISSGLHFHKLHAHKGSSSGHQDVNLDISGRLHRLQHSRIRTTALDELESLSDIDDVEVIGYFHNTKEMQYKKIIWEAMNREYPKRGRQQKRAIEAKKGTPAKKAAKTPSDVENKRLSSKINYDALKKLTDELNQSPGTAQTEAIDSDADGDGDGDGDMLSTEIFRSDVHESGKSRETGGNFCHGYEEEEEEDGYYYDEDYDYED